MLLAEKNTDCIEMLDKLEYQSLTQKQLEAIKNRASEIWGDNWLAELAREYEKVTGANPRSRFSQLQRCFKGVTVPNLDTVNGLLIAVNCRFKMDCFDIKTLEF